MVAIKKAYLADESNSDSLFELAISLVKKEDQRLGQKCMIKWLRLHPVYKSLRELQVPTE